MQYKFATQDSNYSDLSSGRVFYSLAGHPAFPVRLASEIFQRCMALRADENPCLLYDPCCGAGYQLSVLACLHWNNLRELVGSDIDEKTVSLAKQNLGLLSVEGLEKRARQIAELSAQYGKSSHQDALASAHVLRENIAALSQTHPLKTDVFQASALDGAALRKHFAETSVDIVLTDIPYGQHSQWQAAGANPVNSMLDALLGILSPASVVAISSDKQQKISHERYQRIQRFQIGKRRVVILRPVYA